MHTAFTPLYTPFAPGWMGVVLPLILVLVLWTLTMKGFSLWYAARSGHKWWFVILLIVNTLGILELVYLLFIRAGAPYKKAAADKISSDLK